MLKQVAIAALLVGALSGASAIALGTPDAAPKADIHLVPISEVVVPVVDSGRVRGLLRFRIVIDAADAGAAARITAGMPRLRSDLIATGSEFSRLYVSAFTPVDANRLITQIDAALRHDDPEIARVLIVGVSAEVS